jgi:hypothetical protein
MPPESESREFISEPVEPDPRTFDRAGVAPGEPAWPLRFGWRGQTYEIVEVVRTWRTTSAGPYTTGDVYLRRHYAEVRTACGEALRIYGERGGRAARWFLHSRVRR